MVDSGLVLQEVVNTDGLKVGLLYHHFLVKEVIWLLRIMHRTMAKSGASGRNGDRNMTIEFGGQEHSFIVYYATFKQQLQWTFSYHSSFDVSLTVN